MFFHFDVLQQCLSSLADEHFPELLTKYPDLGMDVYLVCFYYFSLVLKLHVKIKGFKQHDQIK